jgi:hypothetical protein
MPEREKGPGDGNPKALQQTDKSPISVTEFRRFENGRALKAFFTLTLHTGLVFKSCSFHRRDGSEWVGLPRLVSFENEGAEASFQRMVVPFVSALFDGRKSNAE